MAPPAALLHLITAENGGAGFYRFLAWARTKPNDVSPGHAILC